MPRGKKYRHFKEVELERHYIDCTNNEEFYNNDNLEVYCEKVCCNVFNDFYKEPLNEEENTAKFPCFMIENPDLLDSPPYLPFTPSPSFLEEEGFPTTTKTIKYKFHECRCKKKHCWLRNSFPTYHPETGAITSVVNHKCIKNQCPNHREFIRKTTSDKYPLHSRNHRQIIIWDADFLQIFEKNSDGSSILEEKHLGRIVICLNHFPLPAQKFFWENGFMIFAAVVEQMAKVSGDFFHRIAREALYEQNMLPSPNPEPLYPFTLDSEVVDFVFHEMFEISEEENETTTTAVTFPAPALTIQANYVFDAMFQSSDEENDPSDGPTASTSNLLHQGATSSQSTSSHSAPAQSTSAPAQTTSSNHSNSTQSTAPFSTSSSSAQNLISSEDSSSLDFEDSEEFYQSAEELLENSNIFDSELNVTVYYELIFRLQKLLPKEIIQICPFSNQVTEDQNLQSNAKDLIFGFGIWQINISKVTAYFFFQADELNEDYVREKRKMLLKKFNDSAEENGFSRPSNCLCQKTFTAKNVSLTAAFVALIATEKKNWETTELPLTNLKLGPTEKVLSFKKQLTSILDQALNLDTLEEKNSFVEKKISEMLTLFTFYV